MGGLQHFVIMRVLIVLACLVAVAVCQDCVCEREPYCEENGRCLDREACGERGCPEGLFCCTATRPPPTDCVCERAEYCEEFGKCSVDGANCGERGCPDGTDCCNARRPPPLECGCGIRGDDNCQRPCDERLCYGDDGYMCSDADNQICCSP